MLHRRSLWVRSTIALLPLLAAPVALGSTVTDVSFIATDAAGRVATARFEIVGTSLVIMLTNASADDVVETSQVLCAVFFDVSGPRLNLNQAAQGAGVVLSPGSTILFGGRTDASPPYPVGSVGGEWGYREGLSRQGSNPPRGAYAASSGGYGLFQPSDRFPGANLEGGVSLDGLGYGLTSAGDDPATGHPQVRGNGGSLIKNGVIITLQGLPLGFSLGAISNVGFQYGKNLNDIFLQGIIPEPATLALLGLAGLLVFRRRR